MGKWFWVLEIKRNGPVKEDTAASPGLTAALQWQAPPALGQLTVSNYRVSTVDPISLGGQGYQIPFYRFRDTVPGQRPGTSKLKGVSDLRCLIVKFLMSVSGQSAPK